MGGDLRRVLLFRGGGIIMGEEGCMEGGGAMEEVGGEGMKEGFIHKWFFLFFFLFFSSY